LWYHKFGNLWKHEDHFWNVSLMNKIIKICVAYPIYFLNPCENFHHQIKKLFCKIKFFWSPTAEQLSKFHSGFRLKFFHLGSQNPVLKIKMTLIKNLYEISLLNTYCNFSFSKTRKWAKQVFSFLKYSGDSEKFCFRLIFFLFKFACRRKIARIFISSSQIDKTWNTLTRLCAKFFFANSIGRKRVPRKRQYFDDSFLAWK
jgi:hypothetical protein